LALLIGMFLTVVGIGFLTRNEFFTANYMRICMAALLLGVWTAFEGTRLSGTNTSLSYILCVAGGVRALTAGVMTRVASNSKSQLAG
jgi:hypothetical protein